MKKFNLFFKKAKSIVLEYVKEQLNIESKPKTAHQRKVKV